MSSPLNEKPSKEGKPRDSTATSKISLPEVAARTPKVRHSGHLVDQKLKYNDPSKTQSQLTIFDARSPALHGDVERYSIKYEGIRFSPSEERLVTAIYTLLKEKSESKDVTSEKFYKGNYEGTEIVFGGVQVKPACLFISRAELYKAYLGSAEYSGRDIKDIDATIVSLSNKKFLMKYDRERRVHTGKGKKTEIRTDRIEEVQSLIKVLTHIPDLSEKEVRELDYGGEIIKKRKGELIIALNPILTDQINSKYVEYPKDINRRTVLAAGGHPQSVSVAINTLRDYLLRELSAKRYRPEINIEKVPYMLKLDNYAAQNRKKQIKENIKRAIETSKSLGLLREAEITTGAEGQLKYIFVLNPDFE